MAGSNRGTHMSEERFVTIETKLAHQDQALIELNAALSNQQQTLMTLERLCASMSERLSSLGEAMPDAPAGDERPPHY